MAAAAARPSCAGLHLSSIFNPKKKNAFSDVVFWQQRGQKALDKGDLDNSIDSYK